MIRALHLFVSLEGDKDGMQGKGKIPKGAASARFMQSAVRVDAGIAMRYCTAAPAVSSFEEWFNRSRRKFDEDREFRRDEDIPSARRVTRMTKS